MSQCSSCHRRKYLLTPFTDPGLISVFLFSLSRDRANSVIIRPRDIVRELRYKIDYVRVRKNGRLQF